MEYLPFLYELIVCFLLSFLIGFERQYRRRSVGLRTIILVSIGSFLFVTFQKAFPGSDMNRIASQVVAGIGFLGAGVIIKDDKGSVKGLTTAATLWCSAAVGILCGANLLIEAAIGTVVILFINIILRQVNTKIDKISGRGNYDVYYFMIECDSNKEDDTLELIKQIAKKTENKIVTTKVVDVTDSTTSIEFSIANTSKIKDLATKIMQELTHKEEIKSSTLNKKDTRIASEEEEL